MKTHIIEARNPEGNWGEFLVGKFDIDEWRRRSATPGAEGSVLC